MSRALIVGVLLNLAAIAAAAPPSSVPMSAEVIRETAYVRSGPGQDFYATEACPRATLVEAYRIDAGGWLAIRPPAGSFSWVAAAKLQLTAEEDVAEVVADDAVSWAGSNVGRVPEYKWQIKLPRGEQVQVLGKKTLQLTADTPPQDCYQIAPPAGEFRWIHQSDVRAAGQATLQRTADVKLTSLQRPPVSVDAAAAESLDQQLTQLNVALSKMVAQELAQWQLEPLRQRIAEVEAQAMSQSHLQRVNQLRTMLAECDRLQSRQRQLQDQAIQLSAPDSLVFDELAAARSPTPPDPPAIPAPAPNFAASGWLMPVHSARHQAPPFALLDDDGRVVKYVAPQPGLNLRRYVKKRIGVVGAARPLPELRAELVMVERVVVLASTSDEVDRTAGRAANRPN